MFILAIRITNMAVVTSLHITVVPAHVWQKRHNSVTSHCDYNVNFVENLKKYSWILNTNTKHIIDCQKYSCGQILVFAKDNIQNSYNFVPLNLKVEICRGSGLARKKTRQAWSFARDRTNFPTVDSCRVWILIFSCSVLSGHFSPPKTKV